MYNYDFWNSFDFFHLHTEMDGNRLVARESFCTFVSASTAYTDYCLHHYYSYEQWPEMDDEDDPTIDTTLWVRDSAGDEVSFSLRFKVNVEAVISNAKQNTIEVSEDGHIPLPSDEVPGNGPGGW